MRPVVFGIAGGALAAAVLAGCVTGGEAQPGGRSLAVGQCLSQPLDETRVLDDHTLLALDRSGRGALFHMASACLRVDEAVIMRYFSGGPVCGPLDVDIAGSDGGMMAPTHCLVDSVTPLDKAEARRMLDGPERQRPQNRKLHK